MTTTTLQGAVYTAPDYLAGFDQDTALTATSAAGYYADGYRFSVRYLSLGAERPQDLTPAEAALILAAGLAVMPVQHVDAYGWTPTTGLGQSHGASAAADARGVGFPPGMCVWLDLEGVAAGTTGAAVVDYCQAWYAAVAADGYVPGIYVGPNSGLTSSQLSDLSFAHYWSSASSHLPSPSRGFQMFQGLVEEHRFDPDYTVVDARGGRALWFAAAAAVYPVLRAGNTAASDAVRCLQRALVAGGAALAVDGLFGPATTAAVEGVQRGAGLTVDGVVGPATWPVIVAAATAR
ncbi:MAG: DUF1906 domain-containing protein [Myxococcales bacterium]|nr:DUF1906 domain-containing protein [Myxococcales bacterium]